MVVRVDAGLAASVMENRGSCALVARGVVDGEVALEAMRDALEAIYRIPNPIEPDDPLPSYSIGAIATPDGPAFVIDVGDIIEDPSLAQTIVSVAVATLEAHGVDCVLALAIEDPRRWLPPPPPPFECPPEVPIPPEATDVSVHGGPRRSGRIRYVVPGDLKEVEKRLPLSFLERGWTVGAFSTHIGSRGAVTWTWRTAPIEHASWHGDLGLELAELTGPLDASARADVAKRRGRILVRVQLSPKDEPT